MKTISGLFSNRDEASRAVYALEDAGIASDDISVVSSGQGAAEKADATGAAQGAAVGASVGGLGGLLAGVGAFAIPGLGPVIGAGWLATTLMGAIAGGVAGGLIGSLTGAGVPERDAHVYAEAVRRGGTLVSARVDEEQADVAQRILSLHGPVDTEARRREYEADGWESFIPKDIWDEDIGSEDHDGRPQRSA